MDFSGMAPAERARLHVEAAAQAAAEIGATVSELSAAMAWGWKLKELPARPQLTLRKGRRIATDRLSGLQVRRLDLPARHIDGVVTTRERTLLDCLRRQPFDAALAVADSALRDGFSPQRLLELAADASGPGSVRIRRVARHADGRAANPFESVLRAIAKSVPGLNVEPQVGLGTGEFLGQPDLVDVDLGIIIEADSFEFHGGRVDLHNDAVRYNRFVVEGWLVLRFSWDEVMFHPDRVRQVLIAAVAERTTYRARRDMSAV